MRTRHPSAFQLALAGLLVLSLFVAACGGNKGGEPAAEATEAPEAAEVEPTTPPEVEPTAEEGGEASEEESSEESGEENLLNNLLKIGPIHLSSAYSVKEDGNTTSEGTLEGDIDANGNQHMLMNADGKETEVYVIGEDMYLPTGDGQFMPMQGAAKDTPFLYMMGYGGLYAMGIGTDNSKKVGSESVNGFQCDKYEVDWNTLGIGALAGAAGMNYQGLAWVDASSRALIKSQFDWTVEATSDHGKQVYHSEFNAAKGSVSEITKPENIFDINAMLTPAAE